MALFFILLALIWVIGDFAALIFLYFEVGFWPVAALIVGTAALGIMLFRWQMGAVWRQFKEKLGQAAVPGTEAANGMLLFTAACMLIAPLPGLDLVGLALMVPPLRRWVAGRIRNWISKRFEPGPNSFVFQMGGIDTRGWPPPDYDEAVAGLHPLLGATDTTGAPANDPAADRELPDDVIEEAEFRAVPVPVPPTE